MSIKPLSAIRPELAFPSVFSDFFEPWGEWFKEGNAIKSLTMPNVNISESKAGFNLEVAAPGLHKKDFKIEVDGNLLTISADKEENKEEKDEKYSRREYNYSSFSRSFTLPDNVVKTKIEATYDGGILRLLLPKNEETVAPNNHTTIAIK